MYVARRVAAWVVVAGEMRSCRLRPHVMLGGTARKERVCATTAHEASMARAAGNAQIRVHQGSTARKGQWTARTAGRGSTRAPLASTTAASVRLGCTRAAAAARAALSVASASSRPTTPLPTACHAKLGSTRAVWARVRALRVLQGSTAARRRAGARRAVPARSRTRWTRLVLRHARRVRPDASRRGRLGTARAARPGR